MGEKKKCPLFRKPESLSMGKRIGYCDIDNGNTTCEGVPPKKIGEFDKKKD